MAPRVFTIAPQVFTIAPRLQKKVADLGWCSMQPGPAGGGKKEERTKYNSRVYNHLFELRIKVSIQLSLRCSSSLGEMS